MDRDSNDEISGHIVNGFIGAIFLLGGLAITISGWGPGAMGGIPIALGGIGYPVLRAYLAHQQKTETAARRAKREPQVGGYELRSSKYQERNRR